MNNILIFICIVMIAFISCKKNDGYYDYQNKESFFSGTTIEYFQSKHGVYDSLLSVLDRLPEYKELIESDEYTVFTPTNSSFQLAMANLNLVRSNQGKKPLTLQTVDILQLDTLLTKYIAKGLFSTSTMTYVDGLDIETINPEHTMHAQRVKQEASGFKDGGLVTVYYSDTNGSNFVSMWTRTTTQAVDIKTLNSVIHVLGNNHEFGFGEFLSRMNK